VREVVAAVFRGPLKTTIYEFLSPLLAVTTALVNLLSAELYAIIVLIEFKAVESEMRASLLTTEPIFEFEYK
jgi:hypothetical protein